MMEQVLFTITLFAALGSGLIAGVFFGFSVSVMKALGRLPARQGIAAMQTINVVILNPWFLGVFLGTGVVSAAIAAWALFDWSEASAIYRLAGSLLYLIGSILVTKVCNVPLNNALAAVEPDSSEGTASWSRYLRIWVAWNHVRAVASLAATGSFILALG